MKCSSNYTEIRYDRVIGYLYGGMTNWQEAGMPIEQLWQISAARLHEKITTGNISHFFDVRSDLEWNSGHIQEAQHLPLNQLLNRIPDIPKGEEVIVTCGVGNRGNIAASYLQSQGFQHVHSLAGGITAWKTGVNSIMSPFFYVMVDKKRPVNNTKNSPARQGTKSLVQFT